MLLSRQYSITAYCVKSESAAAYEGRVHEGGAFNVQLRHEGTNITGEVVVNYSKMQLIDALIAFHASLTGRSPHVDIMAPRRILSPLRL